MRILFLLLLLLVARVDASTRVVASIAPLGAIAADVMDGVGAPHVLVPASRSPHDYSLRPSDAAALNAAAAVFWVGSGLETFLVKPLATLSPGTSITAFDGDPDLVHHRWRDAGHSHVGERALSTGMDPHLWLSTANAARMAGRIGAVLADIDPGNADRYRANAGKAAARYLALGQSVSRRLAPLGANGYVAFHDAFQYFDQQMSIRFDGAILSAAGASPGVESLRELRREVRARRPACVIIEPQFSDRLARTVTEGSGVNIAIADPLGAALPVAPGSYLRLIENLADAFHGCLAAEPGAPE